MSITKDDFIYYYLENGKCVTKSQLWDGGIRENTIDLLGEYFKFAVIGIVEDIKYKLTKRKKEYKIIIGITEKYDFSFTIFNNEKIYKGNAYLFVGHYENGFYKLTKYHKLKESNNGEKNKNYRCIINGTVCGPNI